MKSSIALAVLGSGALAMAHGFVQEMIINGKRFGGYHPFSDPWQPTPRIGWSIPDNGPVEDVNSRSIVCNRDSTPGALVAPAAAGSDISFLWTEWPESHRGPVMTYLASCPTGDCRKEDPTTLDWFKIDHAGLNADGTWISDTIIKNNNTWTVKIPSELKAGPYLLRHELLALHAAHEVDKPQFYPMCVNLEISGNGNGVPTETVKFPGAYKSTDPGIFINIYYPPVTSYVIPGPDIATFNSSPPEDDDGIETATTIVTVVPVPVPSPTNTTTIRFPTLPPYSNTTSTRTLAQESTFTITPTALPETTVTRPTFIDLEPVTRTTVIETVETRTVGGDDVVTTVTITATVTTTVLVPPGQDEPTPAPSRATTTTIVAPGQPDVSSPPEITQVTVTVTSVSTQVVSMTVTATVEAPCTATRGPWGGYGRGRIPQGWKKNRD